MPKYFKSWFAMDPSFKKNPAHYWITQGYYRDYHHYGYQGLGLEDAWYFSFRHLSKGNIGQPAFTLPGDRYYHCRDWGFGYGRIDQKLNRLTWTEAIKQYNSCTWEGKRRAYLMLGFVVHLLQDQAQPDHAFNVAHAGSGMNEEEAYDRYSYCEIMAAEAAAAAAAVCSSTGIGSLVSAFCGGAAFGIAYGACENSIDPAEMGYERLIADKWNAKSVEKVVKAKGVLKRSSYNAYFDELADYSRKVCENLDLESALGCGSLMLVPPIPGADPDIDSNNASETKPYYDLTAALVPEIVSAGAGLIEHFYDIVNYPPIVQRLAIVQWESGDTPRGFADFGKSITECLRYDAEWIASGGKRVLKNNVKPQKLSLDRPGYVFVQFGPADLAPIKGGREMSKARLRLIGNDPLSGDPIDIDVPLTEAHDGALGTYYWGTFDACNCANDPLMLSVRIEATDMAAHLAGRKPSGVDLDGNPATMTFVDHTKYPSYPIQNYEWGPDENHKMWVAPSAWWSEVNPQELVFPRQRGPAEEKVSLTVWEKGYDCQWEGYNGVPCCQAEWRLRDEVVRFGVGQRQVKNTIAGFGFEASLVPGNLPGEAMLTITVVDRRVCLPGKYEFAIDLEVGVSPNVVKKTISLPVKVE
jgi:hypothetical protein